MSDIIKEATEYHQKTNPVKFFVSFLVGTVIITIGYFILKLISDYVGMWATILIIGIISILIARKL